MIILILFKLTSQSYKEWTKNKSDCQFLLSLNSGFFVYDKTKKKIDRKTTIMANKIKERNGKIKPGIKTIGFFFIMRMMQKNSWNEADSVYWKKKGWTGKQRPWK